MKYYLLNLACVFVLFFCTTQIATAQLATPTSDPGQAGMSADRLIKLDKRMHQFVDDGEISAVHTLIYRKGQIAHSNIYGHEDIDSKDAIKENSIWRIYSMTKPIVSVGIMQQYEMGKFNLNDPVHKYIPAFKNMTVHRGNHVVEEAKNEIKIIDLMRHTSGIGYGWSGGYVDTLYAAAGPRAMASDNAAFVAEITKLPLYNEPGTAWQYGLSTDVLGHLLEVISGQPLDEYLDDHIFTPLGMDDTFFEVPDDKEDRFVTNYTTNAETGKLQAIDHPSMSKYCQKVTLFSGGGGLASTTADYLAFSKMLLNGGSLDGKTILGPKTLELMTQDHCTEIAYSGNGPVVMPAMGHGFGLGFTMTVDLAGSAALGSEGAYGWGGAAGTYFRIDPEEDMIYIMMMQLMPYNHLQAREKFQTLVYQAIVD